MIETILFIGLKALFGKAAVGAVVKTGVGLAGKALVVNDVVNAVDDFTSASAAVDPSNIHGGPEDTNVWDQRPKDIHGNDWGRNGQGYLPTNGHGNPY